MGVLNFFNLHAFVENFSLLLMDAKISSAALKIVSLNVRGVSNFKERRTIFTWCRRKNADVIFFFTGNAFKIEQQKINGNLSGAEECFFFFTW